jgi:hypothetical protein
MQQVFLPGISGRINPPKSEVQLGELGLLLALDFDAKISAPADKEFLDDRLRDS